MPSPNFLLKYQVYIADQLRVIETKRAKGEPEKLRELSNLNNEELIVKWLWMVSIVGMPSCFLAAPFILSLFGPFIWLPLKAFLWAITDTAMIIVFIIFLLAAYFTTRRKDG
jgi:hypothetical protein